MKTQRTSRRVGGGNKRQKIVGVVCRRRRKGARTSKQRPLPRQLDLRVPPRLAVDDETPRRSGAANLPPRGRRLHAGLRLPRHEMPFENEVHDALVARIAVSPGGFGRQEGEALERGGVETGQSLNRTEATAAEKAKG